MRILVVVGRVRRARKETDLPEFLRRVRHGGWRADTVAFDELIAHPPVPGEFDDLAVFGGDGTINACLSRTGNLPIVVAPAGSGNDLARGLGVRSISDAARLLRCGHREKIDLGSILHDGEGELFANGIGIGLDGRVARLHATGLSYTAAAAATLVKPLTFRATLSLDNAAPIEREFLSLVVANGPFSGGGYRTAPKALLDDGIFDLTLIRPVPFWKFLKQLPAARRGDHVRDADVETFRAKRVRIVSENPMPWHLDGEARSSHELEITLQRHARTFYTPLP